MSTDAPLVTPPVAVDPALLPDDPAVLKQLIAQLCEEIRKHSGRVEKLEYHVTLLLRRLYGARSEKLDPRLVGATLDRLTHRCHILEATGESYRLQDARRRRGLGKNK